MDEASLSLLFSFCGAGVECMCATCSGQLNMGIGDRGPQKLPLFEGKRREVALGERHGQVTENETFQEVASPFVGVSDYGVPGWQTGNDVSVTALGSPYSLRCSIFKGFVVLLSC
jgi:hypothetical protein